MKRTTFITVIAAAAVGLTTLSAMAREGRPDFATLDADGNGEVTLSELQAQGAARFAAADTDGDGFLTQGELEAAARDRAADRATRMLERMDANEDGKLSADEIKHPRRDPARMFERLDADNSGGISEEEFQEARARFHERRGGKKNSDN
ncbi:EF-hand domain-containing protein [uncultured Tateyamaria sp.]|uniref:EF-hand domain-containing protein n=1 Tax=uncultured Tateyamaria sp. TaxID=455651 RepID=UPI00262F9A26|nr:EF-hand domain-containing protein [uncultured Tateyamaria sp.]